jgi:hypothetical protein
MHLTRNELRQLALPVLGLALICLACTTAGSAKKAKGPADLVESSMNFDLEDVEPFLISVAHHLDAGFTPDIARSLAAEIAGMKIDAETVHEYTVSFQDQQVPLRIRIVMDDTEAPDLYLFAPSALAKQIDKELERYFK